MLNAGAYPADAAIDTLTNDPAKRNSLYQSSQLFFPLSGARNMEHAQRIHHDQEGRELVGDSGAHWPNSSRGSADDSSCIEEPSKQENILPGGTHGLVAYAKKLRQAVERVRQIDDVGCFRRHVACARHGDAYIRGRESRSIIQAITGHGRLAPLRLQFLDLLYLLRGQKAGLEMRNSQFLGNGVCGPPAVAGKDSLIGEACLPQCCEGL